MIRMDDPNEENIESNWVMINPIDIAEEATVLDSGKNFDENDAVKNDSLESDMESDGISIISECSHLHDGSNEDETLSNNEDENPGNEEVTDNKDDTHSESASVGKTNWTYVHSEINPPEMAASNQFYLNCLQEPVQELSEHELGSIQSDLDSDGISIISDCDSLNEFTDDDKKLIEEIAVKDNCDDTDPALASKFPSGIKRYCNGVLIGTILLATSSIFLGHYFNSVEQSEEDLPIYKEEFNNDLKENVPENINDFKDKYEVPSALAYCQERHKGDDIFVEHNVKKCLNKIERRIRRKKERALKEEQMNKLNKYLKIKEQYLEEKEKFLIKREYELLKAEMKLKNKKPKKNKKKSEERSELNKNTDGSFNNKDEEVNTQSLDINKNTEESLNQFHHEPIINIIKKTKYKEAKRKDVESNSRYEKFIKNRKENKRRHTREYHEKENNHKYNKEQKLSYNLKKSEMKYVKNKDTVEDVVKKSASRDIFSENLQFDDSKERKNEKAKDKKNKGNTNYIILGNKNGNETVNGYWLGRLYKGRSDIRNKRHNGDWYFDRASYRKTKRDKAKWYFDWMMDRELLRYRRSFYM